MLEVRYTTILPQTLSGGHYLINIGRYIHRCKESIIHQRSMPKQSRNKWKQMTKSYREAHQEWANNGRWQRRYEKNCRHTDVPSAPWLPYNEEADRIKRDSEPHGSPSQIFEVIKSICYYSASKKPRRKFEDRVLRMIQRCTRLSKK